MVVTYWEIITRSAFNLTEYELRAIAEKDIDMLFKAAIEYIETGFKESSNRHVTLKNTNYLFPLIEYKQFSDYERKFGIFNFFLILFYLPSKWWVNLNRFITHCSMGAHEFIYLITVMMFYELYMEVLSKPNFSVNIRRTVDSQKMFLQGDHYGGSLRYKCVPGQTDGTELFKLFNQRNIYLIQSRKFLNFKEHFMLYFLFIILEDKVLFKLLLISMDFKYFIVHYFIEALTKSRRVNEETNEKRSIRFIGEKTVLLNYWRTFMRKIKHNLDGAYFLKSIIKYENGALENYVPFERHSSPSSSTNYSRVREKSMQRNSFFEMISELPKTYQRAFYNLFTYHKIVLIQKFKVYAPLIHQIPKNSNLLLSLAIGIGGRNFKKYKDGIKIFSQYGGIFRLVKNKIYLINDPFNQKWHNYFVSNQTTTRYHKALKQVGLRLNNLFLLFSMVMGNFRYYRECIQTLAKANILYHKEKYHKKKIGIAKTICGSMPLLHYFAIYCLFRHIDSNSYKRGLANDKYYPKCPLFMIFHEDLNKYGIFLHLSKMNNNADNFLDLFMDKEFSALRIYVTRKIKWKQFKILHSFIRILRIPSF